MSTTEAHVFNGYLEGITLADIVQLACLERYERKLEVRRDNFQGVIYFSEGEIVHAEVGTLTGTQAFLEIMCSPGGTFSFTSCRTETQTIHDSWNFLLMEAMRFIDERSETVSLAASFTPPLSVLVVDDARIFTKALVKLFDEELAGGRVDNDGGLVGWVGGGKGAVFHGIEVEPSLSTGAQPQFVDKSPPAHRVVSWVSGAIGGVIGDDLVDLHLDTGGAAQVIRQTARFSQGSRHGWKHHARQNRDNGHHAQELD